MLEPRVDPSPSEGLLLADPRQTRFRSPLFRTRSFYCSAVLSYLASRSDPSEP